VLEVGLGMRRKPHAPTSPALGVFPSAGTHHEKTLTTTEGREAFSLFYPIYMIRNMFNKLTFMYAKHT